LVAITVTIIIASFLAAVLAGSVGALFGIGGGVIIVPFLTSLLGLPIHEAIAVSIVAVVATSNAGGSSYVEQKITNVRLAMFMEISTTTGALVGGVVALLLNSWILFFFFGALLLYVAFTTFRSRKTDIARLSGEQDRVSKYLGLEGSYFDGVEKRDVTYKVTGTGKGSLVSAFAGVASGLLGIGGGVIKVGAMNSFMKVPLKAAVATSKFELGVTAATSALLYFVSGVVNLYLVAPVALGTTLGATFGTRIMNKIPSSTLKLAFALLLLYSAYNMFSQGLRLIGGP
jgi:uncharacterized membrane protein YfcA